jgi:hydrogenase maturation protease
MTADVDPTTGAHEVETERIIVMGVGNPLMHDEGVGVRVIEELMSGFSFPDNVEIIDAGTMGMAILNLFQRCDYMLVVDAIDGTGEPAGTVVSLSPEDLAPNQILHSLHDLRLVDVLQAAELIGATPQADCIGVQIADMTEVAIGLTPAVERAVPAAVEAVLSILAARGVHAEPADHELPEDVRIVRDVPGRRARSEDG